MFHKQKRTDCSEELPNTLETSCTGDCSNCPCREQCRAAQAQLQQESDAGAEQGPPSCAGSEKCKGCPNRASCTYANTPEHCPGPLSESAGLSSACAGCPNRETCRRGPRSDPDLEAIKARLSSVKHVIVVLSGKGGVGKSTFSSQLAFALSARNYEVGLLDIDICGPSLPRMLGVRGESVHASASGMCPVYLTDNLALMSVGFLLNHEDDAVVWRGAHKSGMIKQFLRDVEWGDLDYLVIDTPPGTSDEHLSIIRYLKGTNTDGAIIVTSPQEVALCAVRKEVNFCRKAGMKLIGVVENMSGFVCPCCHVCTLRLR